MRKTRHAVVIGAGCSGLVSALLLAKAGLRVTLVERSDEVAPLLRRRSSDGFEFDYGLQYLGGCHPGGALEVLFERLGIRDRLDLRPIGAQGLDEFHGIHAEPIVMPVGAEAARARLAAAFPASGRALDEYFRALGQVLGSYRVEELEGGVPRPALSTITVSQFLEQRGAERGLVELMGAHAGCLMGVTTDECSLFIHLLGVGAYYAAAHRLEGGGGALAQALEERVRALGVEIRTGCEVVAIDCALPRRFAGVRLRAHDGVETDLAADAAIATVHPKRLAALLPERLASGAYLQRVEKLADTAAVCLFNLAVPADVARRFPTARHHFERAVDGSLHHRLSLVPDFSERENARGERRYYAVFPAWSGEHGTGAGCPGRRGRACSSPGPSSELESHRPMLEERMAQLIPELSGRHRVMDGLTPCDLERLNGTWRGSLYGLKCTQGRLGLSFMGPVQGLFLAGQSIVAPGIFGAATSAHLAAAGLLDYQR